MTTFSARPTALAALLLLAGMPAMAQQETPAEAPPAIEPDAGETAAPSETPAPDVAESDTAPADEHAAMLEALSPYVADVQIVGPFTDGERNGIWRTITLQPDGENAGNRFFVQQIEDVDGTVAVSSSTEITEIGELAGAIVSYRVDEPTPSQPELLTLFFDIVPLDGEIAETYELFFTATEPYIFGPASN